MNTLIDEIKKLEFSSGENFSFDLKREYQLISPYLKSKEKKFLKQDFAFFLKKGKFVVINTFGGGIMFLKEPEIVDRIIIESNTITKKIQCSVIYESENRKPQNIKYKPGVGKTETLAWHHKGVFPNLYKYDKNIQNILFLIIGKLVKDFCEYGRVNLAYTKIINAFDIELINDTIIESKLKVELE